MAAPRMCLILSENWTMTCGRDLPRAGALGARGRGRRVRLGDDQRAHRAGPSAGANGVMANPREYALPGNQDPATPWPSSLVLLSAIAAVTTRIRLVAGAVIAPLRHPLLLARELGSLDLLSGGQAGRAADGVLAGRGVRGAGRAVPAGAATCWTSTWSPGRAVARHPGLVLRGALLVPRRLLRAEGVPAGRPGAVAGRRGPAPADAGAHRRLRRRVQPAGPPRAGGDGRPDGRDAGGGPGSGAAWSWSAGPGRCSAARTAWPTSARPWRRYRPQAAAGFTTFCIKPSQFTDDPADVGRLCREIIRRVRRDAALVAAAVA